MFRRMYVIIRKPLLCVLLSYIKVHMAVKYVDYMSYRFSQQPSTGLEGTLCSNKICNVFREERGRAVA
jgi:hypothetical protein